jgi:hypothetical protein
MFPRKLNLKSFLCAWTIFGLSLSGCAGDPDEKAPPPPKGTVSLPAVKVGSLEDQFKRAVITFVVDERKQASIGGSKRYNSRWKDNNSGSYMAQCYHGKCFQLHVLYATPVPKEKAFKTMKNMLPESAPPQSRVDDSEIIEGKKENPVEAYRFGEDFKVDLIYADKSAQTVQQITAFDLHVQKEFSAAIKAAREGDQSRKDSLSPNSTTDGAKAGTEQQH